MDTTKSNLLYAVWHLSGRYFDEILATMPAYLETYQSNEVDDWIAFQLGL